MGSQHREERQTVMYTILSGINTMNHNTRLLFSGCNFVMKKSIFSLLQTELLLHFEYRALEIEIGLKMTV